MNPISGFLQGAAAGGVIGGPVGAVIGGLIGLGASLISSIFGSSGPSATDVYKWAVQGFQAAADFTQSIKNFVWATLSRLEQLATAIYQFFFKDLLRKLFNLFDKLHSWLEQHLGPIVSFLTKVRAYIDRIFNTYVKPFLDLLQHIRQVLAVLRLLGVKWAAALDAKIAQIESIVSSYFLLVKGIVNGLIDITNAIIDPLRLFTKPILVISIRRTINSMIRLATGLPPGFFFPSPKKGVGTGLGTLPLNFISGNLSMNPLPSKYLPGNDGFGNWNGFTDQTAPEDTAVDQGGPLDYFNDSLYPASPCNDAASCMAAAFRQQLNNPPFSGGA